MTIHHRKGLALLFTTEMWERFSFYCMRSLVVLYMTATFIDGGLGFSKADAIALYGLYMGTAYVTPIFGGYISDKWLGQRTSAMIGAFLMLVGHFFMIFNTLAFFYSALALIAIGNGFFKPCMTSILGQLYDDAKESERDSAYSIFYMGINIGGMLAGLVAGWMLQSYGFDWGFGVAGIGMTVALIIFWWGKDRYLGEAGIKPSLASNQQEHQILSLQDKQRIGVILFMFLMTVFYFAAWEQLGGLVPLFIRDSVDRTFFSMQIPIPWLANLDPFFIVLIAPVISILWSWLGEKGKDPYVGTKMGLGFFLMAAAFLVLGYVSAIIDSTQGGLAHWGWIVLYNLLVVLGELCFIPISWAAATKLAPQGWVSRSIGLMLAGLGIGSWLAGWIGSYVDIIGPTVIFNFLTGGMILFGIICLAMNKLMERMSGEKCSV